MKIDSRIETIFSHAVALEQAGRLKSVIQIKNQDIYIMNMDKTILFRFSIPSSVPLFKQSCITFNANDYDSSNFIQEDDKIVFIQQGNEYIRKKSCGVSAQFQLDMENIFWKYPLPKESKIILSKEITQFLNPSLSHIEFKAENGEWIIIQRNIYDGTVIQITKKNIEGFNVGDSDVINPKGFGPIGMRTNDFLALFSFNNLLTFYFDHKVNYCRVRGKNFRMDCVIAFCIYDELGEISTTKGK